MTYPGLDTVNATTDLGELLVYANTLTNGKFILFMVGAFFLIALIGSYVVQSRVSTRPKISVSFTIASFVTFGLVTILSLKNGLIEATYLFVTISLTIIGFAWSAFTSENQIG